jgi:nitroimidazol reductase NimA-like FMN-containing flavoprotein (pyridoxamine 5'-phosphate oxidase superfamily)
MKEHQLTEEQRNLLLDCAHVGHLGTIGGDGFPYVTPVHFVLMGGNIYIHGLIRGQKLKNIKSNPKVCFEVESKHRYLHAENPCDTNTAYRSVICFGQAALLDDKEKTIRILDAIVEKYAPEHKGRSYPENMLKMTGVIEIKVLESTGKYFE